MHGLNPKRPPVTGDGQLLDVQHIFPTLQGEGPYAGMPSVFIRLGGCNLACTFCDTEFESFTPMPLNAILEKTEALAQGIRKLVVITGGEPLRQPIEPLCEQLIERGFKVQIETNGTLYRELPKEISIICSPKNQGQGYHAIRPDLFAQTQAFKFIVSKHDPLYQTVPDWKDKPIYVQPMDEYDAQKNKDNLALAVQFAEQKGYILSLQLHKILGIE